MARTSDKADYWAGIIRRYRQSGLTQPQFCRENDVSFYSLRWWLYQPKAKRAMEALHAATHRKACPEPQATARPEVARFLPVRVVEASTNGDRERPLAMSPPPIQVLLGGGRRIAVGPGFDPDVLLRVVDALEPPRC